MVEVGLDQVVTVDHFMEAEFFLHVFVTRSLLTHYVKPNYVPLVSHFCLTWPFVSSDGLCG